MTRMSLHKITSDHTEDEFNTTHKYSLGGFNPFEKYQNGNLPQIGVKPKNI